LRVLFNAAEIAARVEALAREIAHRLPADFMIGLLPGRFVGFKVNVYFYKQKFRY
jgi:hypothetical protein